VLKALAGGGVEAHFPLAAARNLLNGKPGSVGGGGLIPH
jgi:hypothetical protein